MKNRTFKILILALTVITLLIYYYYYQRKDVEVLNVTDRCQGNPCKIDFVVANKTNNYVTCKLSVRVLKRTGGAKSSRVVTPGFAAEKIFDLELYPKEKKEFQENLELTSPGSKVQVAAYNVKMLFQ